MSRELTTSGKLPVLRGKPGSIGDLVGAFESDTLAVFLRTAPVNEHVGLYVLSAMLVIAIVLASVVKIDRAVSSTSGVVVPTAGSIYISPFNTGIIKKINVKVGQVVKKGESLASLDPTFTQADLQQLKEHLASDEAQIAREEAELAGHPYVFSISDSYQAIQGRMWQQRQEQYRSQVLNYNSQIRSTQAQMSQAQSDAQKYANRLKYATEAENLYQPLLDKGYVSKLQVMQASDTKTEMSRLLADAENQISQYRETAAALQGQRDAFVQQWWAATSTQLVADRNDLETTRDSLAKAQKLQDLTSLDAPVDAVVLQIGMLSPGSVASGGGQVQANVQQAPLFTLVPLNAPVEAEIWIASMDNSFIHVGDPVNLKLDAYMFIRHGTVAGTVKSISEGSFTTDNNNTPVPPYFKVRVAIKQSHLHDVPKNFRLVPGETLTGDVIVGRRTILSYLVDGVLRTGAEAMREPE
ncbi:MAG TPA: HlyD family type I secretion periplasmic adaptor subunit [Steroidobacteraceae bacterium]|nr:HlyD family type I secretion periplasmic adaptor subunit [Steroidobacteraceae bacterium]